jgi:hypothetical protein
MSWVNVNSQYRGYYLKYRPHFALPFAASKTVMPLAQDEATNMIAKNTAVVNVAFFMVG